METDSNPSSDFVVKSSGSPEAIELVDNLEFTDDYKRLVCLPYFEELHKV